MTAEQILSTRPSPYHSDVLIIGGGIIGLCTALACAKDGLSVRLVERAQPGDGATHAAVGMLAPSFEAATHIDHAMGHLTRDAFGLWREFVLALEAASGVCLAAQFRGIVEIARSNEELVQLDQRVKLLKANDQRPLLLSPKELTALEPMVGAVGFGALLAPEEGHVDPTQLVKALRIELAARNVDIKTCTDIETVISQSDNLIGVTTRGDHSFTAEHVVIAAGVLAPNLWLEGAGSPLIPVKGQLVSIQMKTQNLRRIIRAGSIYICPKGGNRIIIGASEEPEVDTLDVQSATISALLDKAEALVPGLQQGDVVTSWAGLRPATPDRLPIIGRSEKVANVYYATGHYRHGILLGPLTGDLIARMIRGQTVPDYVQQFTSDRFID
ncbi:MAG: glycine oxidase ThiO [Parvularculaceae bacterium]